MAAYNFQKQFVSAIESGEKTNTIRRIGKRTHAKPGQPIQIYTGMRTKACRKIVEDPTCLSVDPITINVMEYRIGSILLPDKNIITIRRLNVFAVSDGFVDAASMHKFWIDFHGIGRFNGLFISWTPPEVKS